MKLEISTAVKMVMLVFWFVRQCVLVGRDGGSMFLRNVGIYLHV
jgi:hypothetical protein